MARSAILIPPAASSSSATAPALSIKYTAFGKLIKGDDVLEKMRHDRHAYPPDRPNDRPRASIESIKIVPADSIK